MSADEPGTGWRRQCKMWPTPTSHPGRIRHGRWITEQLANQVGGSLNPTWVEWLMGFPLGWTALERLGNAVVPQIPELIGRALLAADADVAAIRRQLEGA